MKPFTIKELAEFLPKLKTSPSKAAGIGKKRGLTHQNVVTLRKIMGYSSGHARKFSDKDIDKICDDYSKHPTTLRKLAEKYGTNASNVYQHLKKHGVDIPNKSRFSKIEEMRVKDLWKKGYSIKDIVQVMHRSHASIWSRIKKMEAEKCF